MCFLDSWRGGKSQKTVFLISWVFLILEGARGGGRWSIIPSIKGYGSLCIVRLALLGRLCARAISRVAFYFESSWNKPFRQESLVAIQSVFESMPGWPCRDGHVGIVFSPRLRIQWPSSEVLLFDVFSHSTGLLVYWLNIEYWGSFSLTLCRRPPNEGKRTGKAIWCYS